MGGGNFPVTVLNRQSWPSHDELDLDPSQFEALHAALTRELVVIQGPPGTGKTFIGLKIAQILIENKLETKRRTPILVVCLTNHALDQFLMGIMRYTQKIVRIGGQSRCEELAEFNLRFVRKQTKSREYVKLLINIRQEIGILQREIATFDSNLRITKENPGIVAFEMFQEADILPQDVIDALQNGKFLLWLLEADVLEQQRNEILEKNNIKFELLLEEFDKKIEDLENQKMNLNGETDVEIIEFQQSQLMDAKEWIETKLQNQEISNPHQRNQWIKNLWKLNSVQKWQLYFYWLQQLEQAWLGEIRQRENELIAKNKELAEMQVVEDLEVLRESDVIGMTTTGAARHHAMLRKLGPEIGETSTSTQVPRTSS